MHQHTRIINTQTSLYTTCPLSPSVYTSSSHSAPNTSTPSFSPGVCVLEQVTFYSCTFLVKLIVLCCPQSCFYSTLFRVCFTHGLFNKIRTTGFNLSFQFARFRTASEP
ncbi:hypothetical protein ANANG_G00189030 [Anguilla anguilla]|uniref:Uncharacterized protein n=1 Tax=Anguilla anguilla TaxID=7936 RepID=A0A9D3M7U6_ANGAN|nr:hypothetical protein ANANG_G00189030 [Anguilla anguilla]